MKTFEQKKMIDPHQYASNFKTSKTTNIATSFIRSGWSLTKKIPKGETLRDILTAIFLAMYAPPSCLQKNIFLYIQENRPEP